MAPTAEIQRWSAAAVDWGANATSTGLSYALNQKLRDWIAVVNGNAANVNKQVEMWKDETSSTSSSYQGMVLKVYYNSGVDDHFYWGVYGTNTIHNIRGSKFWNNNGSNGGYGTYSSSAYYFGDTQSKQLAGTLDATMYITYDTTNDQEFFSWCVTDDGGSSTYQDGNTILKASNGQWFCMSNDSISMRPVTYSNSLGDVNATESSAVTSVNQTVDEYNAGQYFRVARFAVVPNTSAGTPGGLVPITYAKNPFLGTTAYGTVRSGDYYVHDQGGPNETVVVCNGYYMPFVSLGPIDFVNG